MKEKEISARTLAEQRAGRDAIMKGVGEELLKRGDRTLAAKFPTYVCSSLLRQESENEVWVVDVKIKAANGSFMTFTDPYHGFPSDFLITQMTLVEP